MQKVKEMSQNPINSKDPKSAYRVILNVNENSKQQKSNLKDSKSPHPANYTENEPAVVAITRLGKISENASTKMLPIQLPKPKAPKFKAHPQLMTRE